MTLKIVERPAQIMVGLQIRTTPMSPEIPALWPKFVPRIDEIANSNEARVSYGVMRHEAGPPRVLHYAAAVSVSAAGPIPAGMESLTLPAGMYALFSYPLSGLSKGFQEIFERLLPSSGYAQLPGQPFFERYGAAFDAGNPASQVEIYVPVRRRDVQLTP
ncbi:MAG: GyrI-like domain-containing protein [Pseudomonadota bacterium]